MEQISFGQHAKFKVICHKCSKDNELFPQEYFTIQKSDFNRGSKPCGCSNQPKWNKEQYLVLARRAAKDRFIVHGFSEEFHGVNTKQHLECLIDGNKWTATINNIINGGKGCVECGRITTANARRINKQQAFDNCKDLCIKYNYKPIGFPNGYKNAYSRFEYACPKHGIQNVSYSHFIHSRSRCPSCAKDFSNFNGYFPERKDEQDFLYVLDFDSEFIKVGRSFDLERRISKNELQKYSGITNIIKLRLFTATHQEIYDTEQEILEELRGRGFQYYVDWSKECFENECLYSLNKLLDICGLTEVKIKEETNDYT